MTTYKRYLIGLALCFSALQAGPAYYPFNPLKEIFADRPWEFIEDHFVLKPEKEARRFLNGLKVFVAGVSSAMAAGTASWMLSENFVPEEATKYNLPARTAALTASILIAPFTGGIGGAKYCAYLIQNMIDYKALQSFVREWPENKFYTPDQFHPLFDNLYATYTMSTNNSEFKEIAPEFVAKVQRAIYEHFPRKYAHKLEGAKEINGTFIHYMISFDIGEILRLVGHIFNAIANSQKK